MVSEGCSEQVQFHAISVLCLATQRSLLASLEFEQLGGMRLIQQVLRTPQAARGKKIAEVCLEWLSVVFFHFPPSFPYSIFPFPWLHSLISVFLLHFCSLVCFASRLSMFPSFSPIVLSQLYMYLPCSIPTPNLQDFHSHISIISFSSFHSHHYSHIQLPHVSILPFPMPAGFPVVVL